MYFCISSAVLSMSTHGTVLFLISRALTAYSNHFPVSIAPGFPVDLWLFGEAFLHYVRRNGIWQFKKLAIRNEVASCRKLASTTNQWVNVEFSLRRDLIFEKTGILELQYFEF